MEPQRYVRAAIAGFQADRMRMSDRLVKAAGAISDGTFPDQRQGQALEEIASAMRANLAVFRSWMAPLESLLESDAAELGAPDLAHPSGYGPEGALDLLLRDWRGDTTEGLEWAWATLPVRTCRRSVVLGSGGGRVLHCLSSRCQEVIGIELSFTLAAGSSRLLRGETLDLREIRLQNIRSASSRVLRHELVGRAAPNVQVVVADATRAPLPDGCADWVVAAFLYDLLPDGRELLREARRLLAPDGTLVLVTVFQHQHEDLWTYFDSQTVLDQMAGHGLEVIDAVWIEHPFLAAPQVIRSVRYQALRVLARPASGPVAPLRAPWDTTS
jgi:SAM-dependent methyltransferase